MHQYRRKTPAEERAHISTSCSPDTAPTLRLLRLTFERQLGCSRASTCNLVGAPRQQTRTSEGPPNAAIETGFRGIRLHDTMSSAFMPAPRWGSQ
mmetsp:Transcript_11194/g.29612  ORF Transcript_11194/g.29612 Transcript_11194/m.29612 type:complete len:95 (+) Transcript_11194:176-460(+)